MKKQVNRSIVELIRGDITEMDTDAVVNAANARLVLGGGVAGAIRRKGGPSIQEECNRIGGTHVGGAVITSGGDLKSPWVIHAVGPRMGEGEEENKLRMATHSALVLADEKGLRSLSFPAISTGVFGFPMDRCATIMLSTTIDYLAADTNIKRVVFCLFDEKALEIFRAELLRLTADTD